jgi:anaerobic magnesium-protoporphyrin IX monomethyl ester cyclase
MKTKDGSLDVLLINPHLEFPGDTSGRSNLYRKAEYLLNMGLLSIATYLRNIGISVVLVDLAMEEKPIETLGSLLALHHPRFVGISNQSCYSYLTTIEYANLVKSINPQTSVMVGGLHASGLPEILLRECKSIDTVVVGEGELVLESIVKREASSCKMRLQTFNGRSIISRQNVINLDTMPRLDYTMYPNYQEFVPYVEESRGCKGGCAYCISPLVNRGIRIRCPNDIVQDVASLKKLYGSSDFHFFIEANNFAVDHVRTSEMAMLLAGEQISWRVESRVDTFPIHLLDSLVEGGLRVLDIGLESASPEMLLRMNKTRNPKEYLEAGIRLAEIIARNGKCLLKLNIMLFYGESSKTIALTREYLRTISDICPISLGIGPVRMDPGSKMYREFMKNTDPSQFHGTFWGKVHCYPINLSPEISFLDANRICLDLSQEFQTSRTYFEAKRHSQLPYRLTYEKFMEMAKSIPLSERQWTN